MEYICIGAWRDLTDGHLYQAGETFPRNGKKVSPSRLSELEGSGNKAGYPLIRRTGEPEKTEAVKPEKKTGAEGAEKPETKAEPTEKPATAAKAKSRKKE